MTPLAPIASAPADKGADRAALAKAAQGFEAIFVRQMLAAARQASFGDSLFDSRATETFRDMQDARFADLAAQSGALGLARQIEAQLAPKDEG
ncbi:MAG: rod-binding protein [Novosphingobium sp.]